MQQPILAQLPVQQPKSKGLRRGENLSLQAQSLNRAILQAQSLNRAILQAQSLNRAIREIHRAGAETARYRRPEAVGNPVRSLLLQCVSDRAEALASGSVVADGYNAAERKVIEEQLADCLIRICSLSEELALDLGRAVAARLR